VWLSSNYSLNIFKILKSDLSFELSGLIEDHFFVFIDFVNNRGLTTEGAFLVGAAVSDRKLIREIFIREVSGSGLAVAFLIIDWELGKEFS